MDRRREPRLSIRRAALLSEGHVASGGTLRNLCEGGCAVEADRRVAPDERVALHLVIDEDEPPLFVDAAQVCWTAEGRFGLKFLAMSPGARDRLQAFLSARLEAGIVVELRRHRRFAVRLPVAFWGNGMNGLGAVINLSKGGCGVESDATPRQGTSLQLFVTAPTRRASLVVEAAAVRWSHDRRFGVEFGPMRPELQEALQAMLVSLAEQQDDR